jgi:hypothetical protein
MAKIVVLELGFEDDDDAEEFADAINKKELQELVTASNSPIDYHFSVIECRVDDV